MAASTPGPGVDAQGRPVIDPTENVYSLVRSETKRQDDLREMQAKHFEEKFQMQREHLKELRLAEKERIDAIRNVDIQTGQRSADVLATQVLATQAQVTESATAFRSAIAAELEPIRKDIAELRKSQYEIAGQRAQVVETRDVSQDRRGNNQLIWQIIGIGVVVLLAYFAARNGSG